MQEPLSDYTTLTDWEIDILISALKAYYIFGLSLESGQLSDLSWALDETDKKSKIYNLMEKLENEQVRRGYGKNY